MKGSDSVGGETLWLGQRLSGPVASVFQGSPVAAAARDQYEEKIRRGTYAFEHKSCFCGNNESVLLSNRDRYGLTYPLVICRNCGLIRSNPCLTAESYRQFYDNEFRPLYGDQEGDLDVKFVAWRKEGDSVFAYLHHAVPFGPGVVLDVGCHTGAMLLPFAEAGWEAWGVDYGSDHLEYGRKKTGLRHLFHGGIERFLEQQQKANLILINHVFEHFVDLDAELGKIRSALCEDGLVFISVPGTYWWITHHCGGNIKYLLQNAHTYQFGLKTLTYVMECGGFQLVQGDERVYALFRRTKTFRSKSDIPRGEFERALDYLRRLERAYLPRWWVGRVLGWLGLKRLVNRWRS